MKQIEIDLINTFQDLSFHEDTHTYYVKDKPLDASVSKVITMFFEEFNEKAVLPHSAKKNNKSKKEIKIEWDNAALYGSTLGSRVHYFAEHFQEKKLNPLCPYEVSVTKFWDFCSDMDIVKLEAKMYHKEYMFGGMEDVILYSEKYDKIVAADYKVTKDLYKNYKGKKMRFPFDDLLDCPLNHYLVQLNLYQILFEQTGHTMDERWIVHITKEGFQIIKLDNRTEEIKNHLKKYYEKWRNNREISIFLQ